MRTLFNPENPFWNYMGKLADVCCMSILWFLTSLPLFTAGAATAAFYAFTLDLIKDREGKVWQCFFSAFRRNFKKATCLWLIQTGTGLFLTANFYAAWRLYVLKGLIGLLPLSLAFCGLLIFVMVSLYLYPIVSSYDFPLKKVIGDSFVMAMGNLHVSITILVLFLLAFVGIYYISGLFFFWIGLAIFFSSYFLWGLFQKYAGVPTEKPKKKKKEPIDPFI